MLLLLTGVLPLLAHNHPSAVAFLTCRHHNFHGSVIPEFLSDEERVKSFCEARQHNQLAGDWNDEMIRNKTQSSNLYNLFVQTPLMQFSPSLVLRQEDCNESILKPLLATKYFTRTLQRCSFVTDGYRYFPLANELLQGLSKVRSLINLDFERVIVGNEHLEIVINSLPSLETLTICCSENLTPEINIASPPPSATKTLRSLTLEDVASCLVATAFISNFPNLTKFELSSKLQRPDDKLNIRPFSSSLPLLTDLRLEQLTLDNVESLKNCVNLSSLQFTRCKHLDLSFLAAQEEENTTTTPTSLPQLTTLVVDEQGGSWSSNPVSFASLSHAPSLRVLKLKSWEFDNDCLQYLEKLVHLRTLELNCRKFKGDFQLLKNLMQNLFQLEELNLEDCYIGNQGAIARALYNTQSRLRVLNLSMSNLVDDDLNGIGALKNTLEVLVLSHNSELTNETLMHCKDLVKLKSLDLKCCDEIDDFSPLKDCLNLEELDASRREHLSDDSFKVFSEEPNSFSNLRVLKLSCYSVYSTSGQVEVRSNGLTEKFFEHLSKNNHLVYQLMELDVRGLSNVISLPDLFQLRGLRRLGLFLSHGSDRNELEAKLLQGLKKLEVVD